LKKEDPSPEQIRKEEVDRITIKETELHLKLRELEKQLDDQKKLAEEMRRKGRTGINAAAGRGTGAAAGRNTT
jgi:hypothetical protein